jgi:hypothetical protein
MTRFAFNVNVWELFVSSLKSDRKLSHVIISMINVARDIQKSLKIVVKTFFLFWDIANCSQTDRNSLSKNDLVLFSKNDHDEDVDSNV